MKAKFDGHFVKRRNVIYERAKFNLRRQEPGESVDSFITSLYGLAEHCGYSGLHDEMIRDRIVVGLRDARLSEKLQLDAELSLDKAVAQVRQAEAVKQQQSLVRGAEENRRPPDTHVGAVLGRRGPSQSKLSQRSDQSGADKTGKGSKSTCGWCGKSPSHAKQQCPAKDAVCHKCSKRGHFRAVCRSAKLGEMHTNTPPEEGDAFMGGLTKG